MSQLYRNATLRYIQAYLSDRIMTPADFAPYYSEKLFILPVPFYVTSYKADAERQNHLIQDEKPNSKLSSKDYKTVAPVKYPTVAGMRNHCTFFLLPPLCYRGCSLRRVHPAELDAVNDAMRPLHNLSQHSMVMASFNQVIARLAFSTSCTRMNVSIIGYRCLTAVPAAQDRNAVLVICRANFSRMSQCRALDHGKVTCFKRTCFRVFVSSIITCNNAAVVSLIIMYNNAASSE